MSSHRHWVVAAALVLTSACAARSGTSGPMMMGGMAHGEMAHDMATMPSLASMMQRADSLVRRTETMLRATVDTTPHAMAMEHAVGDSSPMAAGSLHTMAIGLRGLLQHMDAMHRSGMKMEGDAGTTMMELHQSANGMLGEMERTLQALDRMQAHHAKDRP